MVFLLVDGFDLLAWAGCLEVFDLAARLHEGAYTIETLAAAPSSGRRHGISLPQRTFADFDERVDTLVVIGGNGIGGAEKDEALRRWLAGTAARATRVVSVCTGAFLLAAAGLLDGRRATTHWGSARELESRYPAVEVEHDVVFVRDGDCYTSGAVTTAIDLALALVADDLGEAAADELARRLALFVRRTSGQPQLSPHLTPPRTDAGPVAELQRFIAADLSADLSTASLARHVPMSPRHLTRVFVRETGTTPGAYVETARIDAARRLLAESSVSVASIALRCGFGSAQRMRRAFQRRLGVTPAEYRRSIRDAV